MYKCNECGEEFEEPKIIREQQGYYHGSPAYEEWAVCPRCEDNNYSEITENDD